MIIIRTQDRETIGKYAEIKANENVVVGFSTYGSMTVLGSYSCRERAIAVIHEIAKCISKGTVKDYLDHKYRIKQDFVYYMPVK